MAADAHVLLVDDDDAHVELMLRAFARAPGFRVTVANTLAEARRCLAATTPDLVITDLRLPDGSGVSLAPGEAQDAAYAVVIMTSGGDETVAVQAMKAGALDYVTKSDSMFAEMPHIAQRALREWRLVCERRRTEHQLALRERELRHAQKMEAIGRLASSVAHDFNNVLMSIIGCADVALATLPPSTPGRGYVVELKKVALRSAATARSLLSFSRSDVEPAVLTVDEAVAAARDMLRLLVGEAVTLQVEFGAPGEHVRCGPGEIEQVIMNLAVNARDAMPTGGRLRVRSEVVTLDARSAAAWPGVRHGRYALLSVSDTGTGMDETTRTRAFEPFFTTKDPGKGTGLGLASVYGTVQRWGGRIELDTALGAGTTFRIYVPIVAPDETKAEAAPVHEARVAATVLVVEDEELVRLAIQHYLQRGGHTVLAASGAEQARQLVRACGGTIDLLLSDVALPVESGPALAAELCAERPTLRAVFMSGHANQDIAGDSELPRGAALLRKPFGEAELLTFVDRALAQPLAPAAPAPVAESVASQDADAPTLLFVEDDVHSRSAGRELLALSGFRVLDAADVETARAIWRARGAEIDTLVTDLSLPDGSGTDLALALRGERADLGVVFVTGRSCEDAALARALRAPHTRLCEKPVEFEHLASVLHELGRRPQG